MNVKELVDTVEIKNFIFDDDFSELNGDYISKSDFYRVVEELTKWNKVEDCLPELENGSSQLSKIVLIKDNRGGYCTSYYNYKFKKWSLMYSGDFVTEWRYIY